MILSHGTYILVTHDPSDNSKKSQGQKEKCGRDSGLSPAQSIPGLILHPPPAEPGSKLRSFPALVSCGEVTQSMVESLANVLIAWPKDCQAVVLITMINGFNLLRKSNVLSLCCQNLAPMSSPSPHPSTGAHPPSCSLSIGDPASLEPRHLPAHHGACLLPPWCEGRNVLISLRYREL